MPRTSKKRAWEQPVEYRVEDPAQLKALSHPLRQRILEQLTREPRTTKQVAERLGEKPTRLYHHVATLERVGLVRLVETRQKRGTTEKYFLSVARRIVVEPSLFLQDAGEAAQAAAGANMIDTLFDQIRAEVKDHLATNQSTDAEEAEGIFACTEIDVSPAQMKKLTQQLLEIASDLPESEGGVAYRFLLGFYPMREPEKTQAKPRTKRKE